VRGKMISDISTTRAVAPVPLDLSTAVSGLTQSTSSGDIRYDSLKKLVTCLVELYDRVPMA
jgi:hypothetical protein